MPEERIEVYFKPIVSVFGWEISHENIIYTNSSGQQQILTAAPSGGSSGASGTIGGLVTVSRGASIFGTLISNHGAVTDVRGATYYENGQQMLPHTTIATGTDLSSAFQCMINVQEEIEAQNLSYEPLTRNSNSMANTSILACGYTPPADTGFFGPHWAPAAGNIIDTSLTNPASTQTTSLIGDGAGDYMLSINEYANGAVTTVSMIDNISSADHVAVDGYADGYFEYTGGYSAWGGSTGWGTGSTYSQSTWSGGSSWAGGASGKSYGGGWYDYWS